MNRLRRSYDVIMKPKTHVFKNQYEKKSNIDLNIDLMV